MYTVYPGRDRSPSAWVPPATNDGGSFAHATARCAPAGAAARHPWSGRDVRRRLRGRPARRPPAPALHRRHRERRGDRQDTGRRAHRPHAPQSEEPGRDAGRAPVHLVARRQDPQVAGRHAEGRERRAVRPARPQPGHLGRRAGPTHARQLHCRRPPRRRRRARGGRDLRRRHPRRGRRHGHPDRRRAGQDSRRDVARGEDGGRQAPRGARCVPRQALRRADRRSAGPLAVHDLRVSQGDPARGRRRAGRQRGRRLAAAASQARAVTAPRRAAGGKR